MDFSHPAWKRHPLRTPFRVAASFLRRRISSLSKPVVSYDDGRSRLVADLSTPLGLGLYRYGVIPDPDHALVRALLRPGDTFVDGGTNIGLFALVAAARVGPTGKVIAFEPSPWTRGWLARNVNESGMGSIVDIRPQALADGPGELTFTAFDGAGAGMSSFAPQSDLRGGHSVSVEVTTLDVALASAPVDRIRVIKLDLEGAEYRALLGAKGILRSVRPDLLVELEPEHLARQGASAGQVIAMLENELGYAVYATFRATGGGLAIAPYDQTAEGERGPNIIATVDSQRLIGVVASLAGGR